jgi:hypothetical protein
MFQNPMFAFPSNDSEPSYDIQTPDMQMQAFHSGPTKIDQFFGPGLITKPTLTIRQVLNPHIGCSPVLSSPMANGFKSFKD